MRFCWMLILRDKSIEHSCSYYVDSVFDNEDAARKRKGELEEEDGDPDLVWEIERKILHRR